MVKKTSVAGAYAKKEPYDYEGTHYDADIKNGDIVKVLNAGDVVSGEFGEQNVFQIMTRNGEKNATFNQSSINALIDAYGDDSEEWVGKEVKVLTKKDVVANKKVIIAYLVPTNYILNEWGELEKEESAPVTTNLDGSAKPEYPEEEITEEDIPF